MSRPSSRGRLKAVAVGVVRLYHSPSTRKDRLTISSMKAPFIHPVGILFVLLCASPVQAQTTASPHYARVDDDVHFTVPSSVARFTPPVPKAPLPPTEVIDRQQSRLPDGGILTLEQMKHPIFPDPPATPQRPASDPTLAAQFKAKCIAWNKAHPRVFLSFSANSTMPTPRSSAAAAYVRSTSRGVALVPRRGIGFM